MSADQYLSGVCAVILEKGLGSGRTRILCRRLEANGGRVVTCVTASEVTHLLVGSKVRRSRLPVLLGGCQVPSTVRVVRADWLSSCLTRRELVSEEPFVVPLDTEATAASPGKVGLEEAGAVADGEGGDGRGEGEKSAVVTKDTAEEAGLEDRSTEEGSATLCVSETVSVCVFNICYCAIFLTLSPPRRHGNGTLVLASLRGHLPTVTVIMLTPGMRRRWWGRVWLLWTLVPSLPWPREGYRSQLRHGCTCVCVCVCVSL